MQFHNKLPNVQGSWYARGATNCKEYFTITTDGNRIDFAGLFLQVQTAAVLGYLVEAQLEL